MQNYPNILNLLPKGLQYPLLKEYADIINNFSESKWSPSELSAGKFCEIVYTIINGFASGNFPSNPSKPNNFVDACKKLESNRNIPRSFQILIPRLLPPLYEIRNNRGVGHVGGDVDPNCMDASAVVSIASWIMAELIRVFHNTTTQEAQKIVDSLVERKLPLVWKSGNLRRVLNPDMPLKDQVMILIASSSSSVTVSDLCAWLDQKKPQYVTKILLKYHSDRFIELNRQSKEVILLPPGSNYVSNIIKNTP